MRGRAGVKARAVALQGASGRNDRNGGYLCDARYDQRRRGCGDGRSRHDDAGEAGMSNRRIAMVVFVVVGWGRGAGLGNR